TAMAKTADGRIMVLSRASYVFLWRADTPDTMVPLISQPRQASELPPSPAGRLERKPASTADAPAPRFRAAAIAPPADRLYLIDQRSNGLGLLRVWTLASTSASSQVHVHELEGPFPLPEGGFNNLALRRDGSVLALGDRYGTVTLFDTIRCTVLGQMNPP